METAIIWILPPPSDMHTNKIPCNKLNVCTMQDSKKGKENTPGASSENVYRCYELGYFR